MEFDTFVRHNLPVISLIGNDAGWNQISREQVPLFGSNVGCQLAVTILFLFLSLFTYTIPIFNNFSIQSMKKLEVVLELLQSLYLKMVGFIFNP